MVLVSVLFRALSLFSIILLTWILASDSKPIEILHFKVIGTSCDNPSVEPPQCNVTRECRERSNGYCYYSMVCGINQPGDVTACVIPRGQRNCDLDPVEWLQGPCLDYPTPTPNNITTTTQKMSPAPNTDPSTTTSTSNTNPPITNSTPSSDSPFDSNNDTAANSTTEEGYNMKNLAYIVIVIPAIVIPAIFLSRLYLVYQQSKKVTKNKLTSETISIDGEGTQCEDKDAKLRQRSVNSFRAFNPVDDATGPPPPTMINAELFTANQEVLERETEAGCQEQVPTNFMMPKVTSTGEMTYSTDPANSVPKDVTLSCDSMVEGHTVEQCTEDGTAHACHMVATHKQHCY